MIQQGKILVPTDFSEQSAEALRRAGVLAARHNAAVHLLHVVEPAVYFDNEFITMPPLAEINQALHDGAEKRLREQAAAADFPVITHLETSSREPSRSICMFADSLPADLILIGRHGKQNALEHLLIGSTAERVVRHANCSVLVSMPHGLLAHSETAR